MFSLKTKPDRSQPSGSTSSGFRSDPRWALVERILATVPFQKSSKLHSLLTYVAEYSILGKAEALTERQIGIAVFGKPTDYSPAEDSAVRVHVRQLRLRLHEYFAVEGRHETQRVEIPKGSYALEFHDVEPEDALKSTNLGEQGTEGMQGPVQWVRQIFPWAAIAIAVICALGWYRAAKLAANPTASWPLSTVVQADRPTRVVVSDSSLMLRRLGDHRVGLDEYLTPDYRQKMIPGNTPENFNRLLSYILDSQLTSFADLTAISSMMKLAGPLGQQFVLTSAHDLDRRDLEQGNYIFVGGPTSNPWVSLFSDKVNFQAVEETVGGHMHFRNRNPLPGEQAEYEGLQSTGSTGEDYATISVLPGQMGRGNVMILQGLRQAGTEALSLVLANNEDRAMLEKAVLQKTKSQTPYFEVLVRSQAVAGAPVSFSIVSVRTIQP